MEEKQDIRSEKHSSGKQDSYSRDLAMAERIARLVDQAGGRVFYVGGFVRDLLMKRENKDIDIEVHGVSVEKLEEILKSVGYLTEMGASFGVFGLKGYDLDIAMPRKEEAIGRGHKDFKVDVDPYLGTEKAAIRRDFTMNALMQDVLTGEIVDHFGGVEDLKKGVLRHVNPDTFVEDPLRVLRGAQFAARFDFVIAEDTQQLSSGVDLSTLAPERIMGELEKALLKAQRPSIFFEQMREMGQLSYWFPELEAMMGVPQHQIHHPEGDGWTHTMLVLDVAAELRIQAKEPLYFMLAALFHDLGKTVCTEEKEGFFHAYGHETEGLPLIKKAVKRITNENALIKYVLNMAELHMRPNRMVADGSSQKAMNHLYDDSICPEDLILLAEADFRGREGTRDFTGNRAFLREHFSVFQEMMARPYVMGRDLIQAGLKPDKNFSELLAYAHKLRLAGVDKESALKQTLSYRKVLTDN
ncbi:MAG: HD domain-containing protein [Lachnospiraceae bacterium]|nr:HD domain-containing protein [Lachnospiraceae bacterium]